MSYKLDLSSVVLICFASIILVTLSSITPAFAVSEPSIFSKGDRPYGIPYEDWIAKWWQWNIQIPKQQHPEVLGPKLTKCPVGESGPVSFLTQSLQGETRYSCNIPTGHAILIPISPGECTSDEAKSSVPATMVNCAQEGDKYIHFDITIDGAPLSVLASPTAAATGLDQSHVMSAVFNMDVPEDNVLDLKPGQWKAVAGGYFAFLKPLPTGNHIVSISAMVTNPIDPSYNYRYHTQYSLNVQ